MRYEGHTIMLTTEEAMGLLDKGEELYCVVQNEIRKTTRKYLRTLEFIRNDTTQEYIALDTLVKYFPEDLI